MPAEQEIQRLFASPLLRKAYETYDDPVSPAALPDAALAFLTAVAGELGAASVFEFGSGRSTGALLRHGCSVTSLEDSAHWMQQTLDQLAPSEKARHTPLVRPLQRRWHGCFPVMDWPIDADLAGRLRSADLILVDSPYFAPFRESTLWSALVHGESAVVILDDTRIPTLSRFCDRIAASNPALLHRRVAVGHTFDIFARLPHTPLQLRHTALDVLKGWRRFFLARRLVPSSVRIDFDIS